MQKTDVSVVLVGISGYGGIYLNALLNNPVDPVFHIAGVVDPFAQNARLIGEVRSRSIPVYKTLDAFYENGTANLAIVSSPIQFHCAHSITAMQMGSHVLCEKPVAATIHDGLRMAAAETAYGKSTAIGFQWSSSRGILALKRDVLAGTFGRAVRFRTMVFWPRDLRYYSRNAWAGAITDSSGNWILDSVASNATAHFLHNMLFVAGPALNRSAKPISVQSELYRANCIQNYDTAVMKIRTSEGPDILFCASHATETTVDPTVVMEFEKATVSFSGRDGGIVARLENGSTRSYQNPWDDEMLKLWTMLRFVRDERTPVYCTVETALPHIVCINGAQDSYPTIGSFPPDLIENEQAGTEKERVFVKGLDRILTRCFEEGRTPSELGLPWAKPGRLVDLTDYRA